ncbi:MAG: response regulator [Candidatus Cloacimonadia bacterium]
MKKAKILWVDDEIPMLKPQILFLEERNFDVVTATNGDDAIKLVEENDFELVLLDEMMPGLDGLTTLSEIKKIKETLPVVMITKNEEEGLMNKAISKQITDYIIKPINPNQVLMSIKKILLSEEIKKNRIGEEYSEFSAWLNQKLFSEPTWKDWIEIYRRLIDWDLKFDSINDDEMRQMHIYEKKNCNVEFANFIESNYPSWIRGKEHPILSPELVEKYVLPNLTRKKTVYFIILDALRLDQFLVLRPYLEQLFNIHTDFYFSILPTSTPYARNAIFSGMMPENIAKAYPRYWITTNEEDESSLNRNEHFFFDTQLTRLHAPTTNGSKYVKILNPEEGEFILKKVSHYKKERVVALVYNFLDVLLHHRSQNEILQEILPNDKALRSLTKIWFMNSRFYEALQKIATQNATVIMTSDHGSIKVAHATKVIGDRETSSGLRDKHGKNLTCNERQAIKVVNPLDYGLPRENIVENYVFARSDYYFVFPTDFHEYRRKFEGTYQHGGVSMEEMILPVSVLTPKNK